jgi:hypothetical protein
MEAVKNFWIQLLTDVESFISEKWTDIKNDAVEDAKTFLTEVKDDVQRWVSLLAEGKITSDDLTWLLKGKREQAELLYLKQKGLSRHELDNFFEGLLQTILAAAFKLIL